jgi:tetratricopeptide (TPR) repeat protein
MDRQRSARPPGLRRAGPAARPQARGARSAEEQIRGAARPGRGDEAVKAFRQAVDLLERGRHAPAIAQALEAKALAPRSALVREMLGIALYRAERFREALRELQAYRRMTGRADQNHLIADCHRALGAPEKAVEPAIEGVASTAPDEVRAEAAVVGAAALADLGRYSEGLGILRSFRPRSRSARGYELRVWYVTGDILERAGRRREAADEFRRVVRHDPGAFDAAERLASLGG